VTRRHKTDRFRCIGRISAAIAKLPLLLGISVVMAGHAAASMPDVGTDGSLTSVAAAPNGGYWLQRDGSNSGVLSGTYALDGAPDFDNVPDPGSIAAIPGQEGYWVVGSNGRIFERGTAPQLCGGQLSTCSGFPSNPSKGQYIIAAAATPDGQGLWALGADGKLWTAGSARPFGDVTKDKAIPTGIVGTPSGNGYYIVKADGGVFSFGDAVFYGSTGGERPNGQDATGLALSLNHNGTVNGYWMVFEDGGVFTFGNPPFLGSSGGGGARTSGIAAFPGGRSYAWVKDNGLIVASQTIPTVVITNPFNDRGMVIDAPDPSSGAQLVMANPNGGASQQWDLWPQNSEGTVVRLVNVNSDLCADLPNNNAAAFIEQHGCHGGVNQLWRISTDAAGNKRFEARGHHGYYLGIATTSPGSQLDIINFPPFSPLTSWAFQ
jgi:hypothetical protein